VVSNSATTGLSRLYFEAAREWQSGLAGDAPATSLASSTSLVMISVSEELAAVSAAHSSQSVIMGRDQGALTLTVRR
jgi:hypothetical protein